MFDVAGRLDELRCWPTDRLVARREDLVREQRRMHVEELTVLRVLDERGRVDDTIAGRDGVSTRTVRESLETARALESLPAVAAAAHAGKLSREQLGPVVQLADESTDAEWAVRAAATAPADLARQARCLSKPTVEDSRARYAARSLRMWWTADKAMLHLHGQLPDVMGATFENAIQRLTEQAKPAKGQPWDSWEHRAADALVGLCDPEPQPECETPTLATKPLFVVAVPQDGPAEIAGIPLPDAIVEQLRANATIEPVLVDDHGVPITVGKRFNGLSPKIARAVLLRDGHCRIPGCEIRHGLHIHHLRPRSWGGTDDVSNLAAVCVGAGHHQMLVPHGPRALVGNPNQPHGLRLVHLDNLTEEQAEQLGLPPPQARSGAR
jgi:predicted DNA-binding protein (UPF0251 family)